jgi:hypothetical protein
MWTLYIILITLHFIFDWILQPRNIAKDKKKNTKSLMIHMLINIMPFSFLMAFVLIYFNYDPYNILGICTINFISHFLIDLALPSGRNEREMINWTAVDQILHVNILIILVSVF